MGLSADGHRFESPGENSRLRFRKLRRKDLQSERVVSFQIVGFEDDPRMPPTKNRIELEMPERLILELYDFSSGVGSAGGAAVPTLPT